MNKQLAILFATVASVSADRDWCDAPVITPKTTYTELGPPEPVSDVYCGGTISAGYSRTFTWTIGGEYKFSDLVDFSAEISEAYTTSTNWSKRPDSRCDCCHVCYRQAYVYGTATVTQRCCSQTNIGLRAADATNSTHWDSSDLSVDSDSNHTSRRLHTDCSTEMKEVDYEIPRQVDNMYDLCFDYKAPNCLEGPN